MPMPPHPLNQSWRDDLTPTQLRVLLFILDRHAEGKPITRLSIMRRMGWSGPTFVSIILQKLKRLGLVGEECGPDHKGPRLHGTIRPLCTLDTLQGD